MELSDFDYQLPKNLIAQKPIKPRDNSRLLIVSRRGTIPKFRDSYANRNKECKIEHKYFYNIVDYLKRGDVLVLNNSKVFLARLIGKKKDTGGKIEVFLHQRIRNNIWNCLLGGRVIKEGLEIEFQKGLKCKVMKNNSARGGSASSGNDGTWEIKFNMPYKKMMKIVEKIGRVPLPPYIKRSAFAKATADKDSYQTVYAEKTGSVAAPTAGFHFTKSLINKLKKKGVQLEYVTLHVGLGTFAPVKMNDIKKYKMHSEYVEIKKDVAKRIIRAKKEGRKIIAVGTTSVRSLESVFQKKEFNGFLSPLRSVRNDKIKHFNDWVDIFIYPGYKFKIVDAMITNFHLPKSTLLMLVSAFADKEKIKKAYKEAIRKKYRFYSYGDAMFIY